MNLLAQSCSTKTEWCLIDDAGIVQSCITDGINPFFQKRVEISRIIRSQLVPSLFTSKLKNVYFYGINCSSERMSNLVKLPLETQFRAPVVVENNLLGTARALFQNESGIACLLDTESSSCFYDGTSIIKTVRSLGYILNDEGSGTSLGKCFLSDCLQNVAPKELIDLFYKKHNIEPEEIINYIYTSSSPNVILSVISYFLYENINHPYVYLLVYNNIKTFLERTVVQYEQYFDYPVRCTGSIAKMYSSILKEVAQSIGVYIDIIIESPMKRLAKYHLNNLKVK